MKRYILSVLFIVNMVRLPAQTASGSINSIANNDTITYNGSSAQQIPAGTFTGNAIHNLAIGNNAGVINKGALTIDSSFILSNIAGVTTPLAAPGKTVIITGSKLVIKGFSGTPAAGQTYTLLSADTLTGVFASAILPTGVTATITYPSNTAVLTINSVARSAAPPKNNEVPPPAAFPGEGVAFSVYPSPSGGRVAIVHGEASVASVIVINTFDGRQVLRKNVAAGAVKTTVDVSNLLPGAYLISYKNDNTIKTKIFIKE